VISTNDFGVEYHGSIVLLAPLSKRAHAWCDEHMHPDALTFADAHVVEPGCIGSILLGIDKAGLTAFEMQHSAACCRSENLPPDVHARCLDYPLDHQQRRMGHERPLSGP
jgi:hypothetical protein